MARRLFCLLYEGAMDQDIIKHRGEVWTVRKLQRGRTFDNNTWSPVIPQKTCLLETFSEPQTDRHNAFNFFVSGKLKTATSGSNGNTLDELTLRESPEPSETLVLGLMTKYVGHFRGHFRAAIQVQCKFSGWDRENV